METDSGPKIGTIVHHDLTVPAAERVRDFYAAVVGWTPEPVAMGDYDDYAMRAPGGEPAAGVCHARGVNADLPPQWLMYVAVEDLVASIARCEELGGEALTPIKGNEGEYRYCVIRDPAGAVLGLMQLPS